MPRPLITLTTDFGEGSHYVAQMKGAILSLNREVTPIDITHAIQPQHVLHGTIVLADCWRSFPDGTIHVAVVDPGVGTERALVCATCDQHYFVLPDNGLISGVLQTCNATNVVRLSNSSFHRPQVSNTFHGRDIMAPVAAHLSLGVEVSDLGEPHSDLKRITIPQAIHSGDEIIGQVIMVDSFGNLITNIDSSLLSDDRQQHVEVFLRGVSFGTPVSTYGAAEAATLVALFGSAQRLELAVVNGNAADRLDAQPGDEVRVGW